MVNYQNKTINDNKMVFNRPNVNSRVN
jgi:hypothetical protein